MHFQDAFLLALLSIAANASPVDNHLDRMRATNRLESRAEPAPANVDLEAAFKAGLAHAGIVYPQGVSPLDAGFTGLSNSTRAAASSVHKRQPATKGRVTGSLVTSSNFLPDSKYLWPITVGKTVFKVTFNSLFSDIFLYSKSLPSATRKGHTVYQNTGTPQSGETFSYKQLSSDSTASGPVYSDSVTIGQWNVPNQWLGSANKVSSVLAADMMYQDGVVGWGGSMFSTCLPTACQSFLGNLFAPIESAGAFHGFAATFRPGATKKNSTWDIGFIDPALYTGSVSYTQSYPDRGYWDFFVEGWSAASDAEQAYQVYTAIDTIFPWVLVDSSLINYYYSKVPGATYDQNRGLMVYPCKNTLPSLSIWINGVRHKMTGEHAYAGSFDATTCLATIQWNGDQDESTRLGLSFLKSQYVVFRNDGNYIPSRALGFAQQKV